jgi:hypothetical protein
MRVVTVSSKRVVRLRRGSGKQHSPENAPEFALFKIGISSGCNAIHRLLARLKCNNKTTTRLTGNRFQSTDAASVGANST